MAEQKNVYLYCGSDEYVVGHNAKQKVDAICPAQEQSLSLEVLDGSASKIDEAVEVLNGCIEAFRTVGLFGGQKVVWLRAVNFFSSQVIMKNEQVKRLVGYLTDDIKKGLAPDQFLVISASGIDKRSAFYKAIKESGEIAEYNIPERDYEARPLAIERTAKLLKREGFAITNDALDAFIGQVGYDTRMIVNEVEKLILYKGAEKQIVIEDIHAITSAAGEAISWDFADAVAGRQLGSAIRLFRQLLFQKESPVRLIISVESLFQNLLQFREYMDAGWLRMDGNRVSWTSDPEAELYFSEMPNDPRKMHWYRASKLAKQAQPYSAKALAARKRLAVETHERMLSEGTIPHELMFETLLARLCAPKRRRA
ncbi:MAG: DNA polymerase III subunit delta [Kiritimatiellales bacterium]|nr:DNA polymerase III subunit delta [Kiritimatiellales bacterium]